MKIEGDTALVTGGGNGIGRAIAVELARKGLDVVIADVDPDGMAETASLVESHGRRAVSLHTDVSDESSVEATVESAIETFGSIDVLVNNAGIAGPTKNVEDVTVEEWETTLGVNLRGAFLVSRSLMGKMKDQGYGRIVNISSASGKRSVPQRSPYTASKSGLLGLTRTMAVEGGEYDVNVNAVCPGTVAGPRIDRVIEREAEASGRTVEAVATEKRAKSPRNEFVQPEDVAEMVAYLCSSSADRITGQSVNVSAGKLTH